MDQEKDFLQSESWLRFQEAAGSEVVRVTDGDVSIGGIIHELPFAGGYFYTPRFTWSEVLRQKRVSPGPVISKILEEAKSRGCGWVRIEPENESLLESFGNHLSAVRPSGRYRIVKAPHDMQPKEVFVVDIAKSEEELLAAMKPKVRYNIRLAEKKGVRVFASADEKYRTAFVDLVAGTAHRKGITPHSRKYYETMLETLLGECASLFVAEHDGDILGINLMIFYGDTAIYLHGGSGDVKREYMAPFLLQWEAMKEAKRRGCTRYDFGGVKTANSEQGTRNKEQGARSKGNGWEGITRFKTGFSPATVPTAFPGCYDIILSPSRYFLYRFFSAMRSEVAKVKKAF